MKEIKLSQGKVTKVSDEWYEYLNQWKWFVMKRKNICYAIRMDGKHPFRKTIYMHRIISNAPDSMFVDHIDNDGLNNIIDNLRICNNAENQRNRRKDSDNHTGFKGVSWHKQHGKFISRIKVNNKTFHLGYFDDPKDAAHAYDSAARIYFGKFARLNFPEEHQVHK